MNAKKRKREAKAKIEVLEYLLKAMHGTSYKENVNVVADELCRQWYLLSYYESAQRR